MFVFSYLMETIVTPYSIVSLKEKTGVSPDLNAKDFSVKRATAHFARF